MKCELCKREKHTGHFRKALRSRVCNACVDRLGLDPCTRDKITEEIKAEMKDEIYPIVMNAMPTAVEMYTKNQDRIQKRLKVASKRG